MSYLDRGYLGLANDNCEIGDKAFLLMGADMPCVLRPVGEGKYIFRGESYIHGIMDGVGLVEARRRADPDWKSKDTLWLQDPGEPPYPFETEEITLI
jgi:hypothetical protein